MHTIHTKKILVVDIMIYNRITPAVLQERCVCLAHVITLRKFSPQRILEYWWNFPRRKISHENFKQSGKLPVGKISLGEFPGKSGKLSGGKIFICVLYNNIIYFSIKTLSKRVLKTQYTERTQKVSPRGCHRCFHKTGGNFPGENFPQNFRGKCHDTFCRESFPAKISYENILQQTLQTFDLPAANNYTCISC